MVFEKILITNKNELLKYEKEIAALFYKCFNKNLDIDLWKWAYLDGVCGDPIVSLFFHNNYLVGHYAIIPMKLVYDDNKILAALSMTTMVDASYRRHGIFIEQANIVFEKAKSAGFSLVYGFPNSKSAPGFKKRLGWTFGAKNCVIKVQGKDLINKTNSLGNKISFDIQDDLFLGWRLSKPNEIYIKSGGLILKQYRDEFDVVYHQNNFKNIDHEKCYNLLSENVDDCNDKKSYDYVFGYKFFDNSIKNPCFKVDLIMSDVF